MSSLNCLNSLTSLDVHVDVINYRACYCLRLKVIAVVFIFATKLSPEIVIQAGVLILDENCNVCFAGSNRFFKITDRQGTSFTHEQVTITGGCFEVTKVMVFTQDWRRRDHSEPIIELS
jgi:hypothetical protein